MSKAEAIRAELAELNPEALFADGFDEALIGIARQFNRHLALYDYKKCIEIVANELEGDEAGLDYDERCELALEHIEFNVVGAWVGENTPVFMVVPQ